MQLDWSTLLLEVINFLVLVWILKRFLYKPVLDVIARRKASIDKTFSDAQAKQAEAKSLEQKYQSRLSDWEQEKDGLRNGLAEELKARRERLTAEMQSALAKEREKQDVLVQRHLTELQNRAEENGVSNGVRFTAKLLEGLACPELEAKLVNLALQDLPGVPEQQLDALRAACRESQRTVKITSAFPLTTQQRAAISEALKTATQQDVATTFQEDAGLLAGLRISVGPWTLRANLQDELAYFAEMVQHGTRKD